MTCKVCPPSQQGSLRPCRARLAQSGLTRYVDAQRDHRGPIRDVEQDGRGIRLPRTTFSAGWPPLYGHDNHESRLSTRSSAVPIDWPPSRVRHNINRPLHELLAHIFGHSLVPLVILIICIAFQSCVIVQPSDYRQIAEDSKIVSGVWFAVGFVGAVCSYKNIKCLKYIHEILAILESRFVRSSATFMWYLSLSIGCKICWKFTLFISKLLWVVGPFIRYVIDDTVGNQNLYIL